MPEKILVPAMVGAAVGIITALIKHFEEKKKKKTEQMQEENIDKEKIEHIVSRLNAITETDSVDITTRRSDNLKLTDSKFGGYPYWPRNIEYPTDENGNNFILLAQINLADIPFKTELPEKGLLQFYITCDDVCGFGRTDLIRYFETYDQSVTEDEIKARGIKANTDFNNDENQYFLPFTECWFALDFALSKSYISVSHENINALVEKILKEDYNEQLTDCSIYNHFNKAEIDYMHDKMCDNFCHRLLGQPDFTQSDIRDENMVLLFQMDSDDPIMWGDCGIANYFIDKAALQNRDFSNVLFNWDCC